MDDSLTFADLLEISIRAEENAARLYMGLQRKFAAVKNVADFWASYAAEEGQHARWLIELKRRLSETELQQPVRAIDGVILLSASKLMDVSIDHLLSTVKDLDQAYELANELEHGEINLLFEFLVEHFASRESNEFLRQQLQQHVARLISSFPEPYNTPDMRRGVRAGS
jgi:rubrerythrin